MCQIARIHVRIDLFVGPDLDPRCLRYSSRCELFNLQLKSLENKKNIYNNVPNSSDPRQDRLVCRA